MFVLGHYTWRNASELFPVHFAHTVKLLIYKGLWPYYSKNLRLVPSLICRPHLPARI